VALLVMLFSWWDWYVDPVHWRTALMIRSVGSAVILATGIVQRMSRRVGWSPAIAKVRFAAAVLAVAGALAVLDDGYVIGVAGLVSVLLAGPYIAIDRRDLLVMNAFPLAGTGAIMWAAGLTRFAVINASIFIALAVAVSLLLARVFEASNRRAFALEQDLMREARTDALTGLRNRRALEEAAATEVKRSARAASPLSVMLCDIDHFKRVNDLHGHDAGDHVIRAVAECLRGVARESDSLGRWGGEEFLVILPDTDEREAAIVAERMRASIEQAWMPLTGAAHVTASFGVSMIPVDEPHAWDAGVRLADDALYRAKADGRNLVRAGTGSRNPEASQP
jgi:diguanylate cyclase (GGDEF)-like protein